MSQSVGQGAMVTKSCVIVKSSDLPLGINRLLAGSGDPLSVTQLRIILPDPAVLNAVFQFDTESAAARTVFDALSIGIEVEMVIHSQLLPMLTVDALTLLPIEILDHTGRAVMPVTSSVIDYTEVALLSDCWVLTVEKPIVTSVAKEHTRKHNITFVTRRGGAIHALSKNRRLRSRHAKN